MVLRKQLEVLPVGSIIDVVTSGDNELIYSDSVHELKIRLKTDTIYREAIVKKVYSLGESYFRILVNSKKEAITDESGARSSK